MNNDILIPEEFYCYETGKPFERCSDCNRDLLRDDVEYSVSKVMRQYEGFDARDVLVEFAVCTDCAENLLEEISDESMEVMLAYQLKVMLNWEEDFDMAMSKCIFSGKPKAQMLSYNKVGFFKGGKLSDENLPYLIDSAELDKVNDELSQSTRDGFDDYYQNLIGPLPDWVKESMPGGKLVLV
ncbi:MAG: hypothetical protein WBA74_17985 [Cyclobacteriaceae bacterium]